MNLHHEANMRVAINAAIAAKKQGGVAIGAAIFEKLSGKLVASGGSIVGVTNDPTAHAEVNAIREAARIRSSEDLYSCVLYSTLEPCHMCLSAAAWAKIPDVFFGAYRKDVDETLFDISAPFSDEQEAGRMNLRESTHMRAEGGILEEQCAQLLAGYHANHKHTPNNN